MANTILHKRSSTSSAVPSAGSLTIGEIAVNAADAAIFTKKTDNSVVNIVTSNKLSAFAATTSAELAGVISDETGSGLLVFGTSPNFLTSVTTSSASFNLFNTTATTINFAGASTSLTMGATTGTAYIRNPTIQLGNTTSTITTNSGITNNLSLIPYGNVIISPTSSPMGDGEYAAVTVTNTEAAGQVQITGADLYIGNRFDGFTTYASNIIFEGANTDAHETTLTITEPTVDRTITLPNATGTVALVAGSDTQVQFNDGGAVGGNSQLTFNKTTGILTTKQFYVSNSSGDEGGEMLLNKPATNTTIAGTGVTIDVYQNKLRFFEQGGSARGFYIDITAGGASAGTNLVGGGGGGTPGGSDTHIQFNDGGSFGGDSNFTYNKTTDQFSITSSSTTVSPLLITASSLNDGVGAFRINGIEPDINLNDTDGGFNTITFENNGSARVAIGRDSGNAAYIAVRDPAVLGGTWKGDALVINSSTGNTSFGYNLTISGSELFMAGSNSRIKFNDGSEQVTKTPDYLLFDMGIV